MVIIVKKSTKIVIGILLLLFLVVFMIFLFDKNLVFDNFIYKVVRILSSDFFDKYFIFVTKAGNTLTIISVVLIFLIISRNFYGVVLTISSLLSVISNSVIKQIFKRIRPDNIKLISQGGYSFPSGHSMIAIAVYGYMLYLVFTKIKNKYLRIVLSLLLIILILSIGISRIYVGVHYPTDVICGYLLGIVELILLVNFSGRRGNLNV